MCNYASSKVSFKSQYWKIDIEVDTNEVQTLLILTWVREVFAPGQKSYHCGDFLQIEPKMLELWKMSASRKYSYYPNSLVILQLLQVLVWSY